MIEKWTLDVLTLSKKYDDLIISRNLFSKAKIMYLYITGVQQLENHDKVSLETTISMLGWELGKLTGTTPWFGRPPTQRPLRPPISALTTSPSPLSPTTSSEKTSDSTSESFLRRVFYIF